MHMAESWDMETQPIILRGFDMSRMTRLLVTDELIEFGKLVDVQDIRTITDHSIIDKKPKRSQHLTGWTWKA